jgi:ATP-binding protein involved in chromosome partitioning
MANELQVPFLGEVPIYMSVREGGDKGVPAVIENNSPVQLSFFQIAEKVAQQIAVQNALQTAAQ